MLKKIKDCTYEEFRCWANKRACDGRWSMDVAILVGEFFRSLPNMRFKTKKTKNNIFQTETVNFGLNTDYEIEVDTE